MQNIGLNPNGFSPGQELRSTARSVAMRVSVMVHSSIDVGGARP